MISIEIRNIKEFMSNLLIKDTYDRFLVSEITLATGNTYTFNGAVNRDFYTKEELAAMESCDYAPWSTFRPTCFSLIKGSKTPAFLKIVFLLPPGMTQKLLADYRLDFQPENIKGLFINIKYQDGKLTCVTGTALNFFTLDKSLEQVFDQFVSTLFE